ncbi:MAG TPA: Maf family protein [Xanthobacteraceae bacterium]|nr:Maf family protein [Xanthobacteraceae bacterium]
MPLWLDPQPLILASQSGVRRKLLEAAALAVEAIPASIDERAIEARAGAQAPDAVALLLACEKAKAVAAKHPGRIVIGADQTLALGHDRFSKPADREAAAAQLRRLRGKTHTLSSAVAVARDATVLFSHVAQAHLTMRDFSDAWLERYLDAAGEAVCASVGAYQLEGFGVHLFDAIDGDYFTILGLPLLPLLAFLRRGGFVAD